MRLGPSGPQAEVLTLSHTGKSHYLPSMVHLPIQFVLQNRLHEQQPEQAVPPHGDAALLDAYSRAVVDIVDEVGPSVTRIDMRRGDGTAGGMG